MTVTNFKIHLNICDKQRGNEVIQKDTESDIVKSEQCTSLEAVHSALVADFPRTLRTLLQKATFVTLKFMFVPRREQ